MLKKESKIRILENFYALDLAVLGKPNEKMDVCCPILKEEYLRAKGALMSCIIEMYKRIEHSPSIINESIGGADLQIRARETAKVARSNMRTQILSESAKKRIKTTLQESLNKSKSDKKVDMDALIESEVRKVGFSKMLDDMLVKRALNESENSAILKDWDGKVLMNAYKTLRENFIATAINLLEN